MSYQGVLWGGAYCADSQFCAPGGAAPLPARCTTQRAVYPGEASVPWLPTPPRHRVTQGGTTPLAAARSPALESAPAVTTAVPSPHGPGCSWGGRGADLPSLGVPGGGSVLAVLGPPRLCLSRGEHRILGCVPRRPGIPGLRCWNRAPGAQLPKAAGHSSPLKPPPDPPASPQGVCSSPFLSSAHSVRRALPRGEPPLLLTQGDWRLHCPSCNSA